LHVGREITSKAILPRLEIRLDFQGLARLRIQGNGALGSRETELCAALDVGERIEGALEMVLCDAGVGFGELRVAGESGFEQGLCARQVPGEVMPRRYAMPTIYSR
jgi:hypothetical protein